MTDFGIAGLFTEYTMQPAELAVAVEQRGFAALGIAEHTHIPTSRETPYLLGGDLPKEYWHTHDMLVTVAVALGATTTLEVGSTVCLIPEHHPLTLAKAAASLDRVSGGRFFLGVGAGWNAEEMENHGSPFADRWKITRENILAMRECWTKEEAEFHGDFVDFDPVWSYPKPVTEGGPPVLMGAGSKWTWDRIVEYCDGWLPLDGFNSVEDGLEELRAACDRAERDFAELRIERLGAGLDEARVTELMELGVDRIFALLPSEEPAAEEKLLDEYAKVVERFSS